MSKTIKAMKKNGYYWLALVLVLACGVNYQVNAQSKRGTGTTSTTLLYDPKPDGNEYVGTSIDAVSDKLAVANAGGGQVKVWSRNPHVGRKTVTTALTTATTTSNIIVESTAGISVGDILYCVPGGVSYTGQQKGFVATVTVVGAGATNVYASAALTTNLSSGSYVYPLSLNYQTFVGSNSVNRVGETLFRTVPDSPLRIILDATATNDLSVTVK